MLEESIQKTIKKLLGFEDAYKDFDTDILMHINTALMSLHQLGVGPAGGFSLSSGLETWAEFFGAHNDLHGVKTYIYFKVRLAFDPPSSSFVLASIEKQIAELEWRLNVQAETV